MDEVIQQNGTVLRHEGGGAGGQGGGCIIIAGGHCPAPRTGRGKADEVIQQKGIGEGGLPEEGRRRRSAGACVGGLCVAAAQAKKSGYVEEGLWTGCGGRPLRRTRSPRTLEYTNGQYLLNLVNLLLWP